MESQILCSMIEHLQHLVLGIKKSNVQIHDFKSSALPGESLPLNAQDDIFDLDFELAGTRHTWQFLMNKAQPEMLPDVVFDKENEDFSPNIALFQQWDPSRASSLCQLISDLYSAFNEHQKSLLEFYPALSESWKELALTPDFHAKSEVYVERNLPGIEYAVFSCAVSCCDPGMVLDNVILSADDLYVRSALFSESRMICQGHLTYNSVVRFLFDMEIDTSGLPPYLKKFNCDRQYSCLCVTFEPPDLSTVVPELHLSPSISSVVGAAQLRLPAWGKETLATYVPKVYRLLHNTIAVVSERYLKRKDFIMAMLAEFSGSVLEYNPHAFFEAAFLLEDMGFHCIVFVLLSEQFPLDAPALVLQSVYNVSKRAYPFRVTYHDYPFDPTWPFAKMVEEIRRFLGSTWSTFKDELFNW